MEYGLKPEILTDICNIFQKFCEIEEVLLYGSRAKGNFRANSDIDLALIGEKIDLSLKFKIENKLDDLCLPYKIDLLIMDKIVDANLKSEINKYGKPLYRKEK